MYRCHMYFYYVGHQRELYEIIKQAEPMESFVHTYLESGAPEREQTARADVILADLRGVPAAETAAALVRDMRREAELIVLAEREQIPLLSGCLPQIRDVWTLPMGEEELTFRFRRWQETCKMNRDFWQTRQYLEATINSTPSLVWFKSRDGIHEKVNDSFCVTVNKTKEQVQGRGHAYIWDVEQDDPACIESERIVMETKKTAVSLETVQTGAGVRLLDTYKSPLYDLDGSVMGTVGVAIDVTQERAYEKEIVDKNHMLEMLFTTMDCGVMCHTLDGTRIVSINRAALRILGY